MNESQAKLLIVDDSTWMRIAVRELMHDVGFGSIDEAGDGCAAFAQFQLSPYDLVITDWNMPNVSGIELLRKIRGASQRQDTPVLVVSGDASAQRSAEAIQAGANGFLEKPFVARTLCEQVRSIVKSLPRVATSS